MNHALVKNYSLVGVHMGGYRGRDEKPFDDCYRELYAMLMKGRISPLVDAVVGFDQLPEMLERLSKRKSKGRIVFDPGC
jgi:NADPH:quinone reductase-like Zn-dependent oxidoreductase